MKKLNVTHSVLHTHTHTRLCIPFNNKGGGAVYCKFKFSTFLNCKIYYNQTSVLKFFSAKPSLSVISTKNGLSKHKPPHSNY